MITFAVLKEMIDGGAIDLTLDKNAFWEQAPLQKDGKPASGVWVITRGGDASRRPKGLNLKTTVDFYVALANKPKTEKIHKDILDWMLKHPCLCKVAGSVGGVDYEFYNIRVRPTTTPQNIMITENNLIVKIASAELVYDIKVN